MAGCIFGVWLNLEDRRRRFPLLNLPESKISQLVEKYGDLAKASMRNLPNDDDEALTVGLLDGQQTPTLYDVRGPPPGRHPHTYRSLHGVATACRVPVVFAG